MKLTRTFEEVIGYEGSYSVSKDGDVVSLPKSEKAKMKILSQKTQQNGYKTVGIYNEYGERNMKYVHRLVAETFINNPLNKSEVNHIDGDKTNNTIENLEWVTHQENAQHASRNGLLTHGEDSHFAKLKNIDVVIIRELIRQGELTVKQISRAFEVSTSTIYNIKAGKIWKMI